MTYNFAINKVLSSVPGFIGVKMYDRLPLKLKKGEVMVVNLATTDEANRGISGHFVVVDNRNKFMFFDPYGLQPNEGRLIMNEVIGDDVDPNRIYALMNRSSKEQKFYSDIDYQAHFLRHGEPDDLCGVYSIAYVEDPDFSRNPVFRKRYLFELENPNLPLAETLEMDRAEDRELTRIAYSIGLLHQITH